MSSLSAANADYRSMNKFYDAYIRCIDNNLKTFLEKKSHTTKEEWCTQEKKQYVAYMKDNFPTEYENILRLEDN